jgi:hydroxymethylglutaryl-CoA lyase
MTNAAPTFPGAGAASWVDLVEVGARDGLQNEDALLESAVKVDLIERVASAGSRRIEVASFVHPTRVPQMADAESVVSALGPSPAGVSYIGLVLNRRGLDRAVLTSIDEVNFVVGASKSFNEVNAGTSPDVTMSEIASMIPDAGDRRTTVTIAVAFGCPFEGEVPVADVVRFAELAANAGADEIALGDTIGVAVPAQVVELISALSEATAVPLRCHFHDTRNTAVANVVAAHAAGIGTFDASVGGAGGCPFAPDAAGNVATEDLLYLFDRMGVETGIDPAQAIDTARWLADQLGRELPGAVTRAGWWPRPIPSP